MLCHKLIRIMLSAAFSVFLRAMLFLVFHEVNLREFCVNEIAQIGTRLAMLTFSDSTACGHTDVFIYIL